MTLEEFRTKNGLSLSGLARELGVGHATMVRRWCLPLSDPLSQIPSPKHMLAIVNYSEGKVQPNDFYGLVSDDRG